MKLQRLASFWLVIAAVAASSGVPPGLSTKGPRPSSGDPWRCQALAAPLWRFLHPLNPQSAAFLNARLKRPQATQGPLESITSSVEFQNLRTAYFQEIFSVEGSLDDRAALIELLPQFPLLGQRSHAHRPLSDLVFRAPLDEGLLAAVESRVIWPRVEAAWAGGPGHDKNFEAGRLLLRRALLYGDYSKAEIILAEAWRNKSETNIYYWLQTPEIAYVEKVVFGQSFWRRAAYSQTYPPYYMQALLRWREAAQDELIKARHLRRRLFARLRRVPLNMEWTPVMLADPSGDFSATVWYLRTLSGNTDDAVSPLKLLDALRIARRDRRLYYQKLHIPRIDYLSPWKYPSHTDRANPFRELLAHQLGRALGANTAAVSVGIIEGQAVSRSAYAATIDFAAVPQRQSRAAQSFELVLNVLIRRWDMRPLAKNPDPAGGPVVGFDYDVGFDPRYTGWEAFAAVLHPWSQAITRRWSARDFDPEALWKAIEIAEKLPVQNIVRRQMAQAAAYMRPGVMRTDEVESMLQHTRRSIRNDVQAAYRLLTGVELPPKPPRWPWKFFHIETVPRAMRTSS